MLPPSPYSKGIRVAGFLEVRDDALIPALEKSFLKQEPVEEVLGEAVKKGNELIRKAEQESD